MFVQVIEGRTKDPAAIVERGERWQQELRPGAIGFLGVTAGVTADGRAITIARFKDEEAARANAARPEQTAWFEGMAKLYEEPPTFSESTDVTEWLGGGSDDAGFVQVMKFAGVDRAEVERLDAALEPFADQRPDLLGGVRIWTGRDSCLDVAYFTSEAEARKGEQAELPEEAQKIMADLQAAGEPEYLDLSEPFIR
jgi:hypothetical protein